MYPSTTQEHTGAGNVTEDVTGWPGDTGSKGGAFLASPTATPSFIHGISPVNMATTSIFICSATFQCMLWNRELGKIKEEEKKKEEEEKT